ncbi:MAG: metalloregulator ArsR/SmtB family transcription factor [Saprospiraceae bacterium]|nr:metalloregulator ArsR/SmtB family transcription factor [Saprospiraceae bacterium]
MKKRDFKDSLYEGIAGITKAFSNANRLEIIDLLANGEKTVEQIALQTAISISNASQHLKALKTSRLVKSRRDGQFIWYSLNGVKVMSAWQALRDLAMEHAPDVQNTLQQFRVSLGNAQSVSFQREYDNTSVFFLDVRPVDEFAAGHLPNAQSIPVDELPSRMAELPRDKTIITYCRGPFCSLADEAVQLLIANGFKAMRLEEGFLDLTLLSRS